MTRVITTRSIFSRPKATIAWSDGTRATKVLQAEIDAARPADAKKAHDKEQASVAEDSDQ